MKTRIPLILITLLCAAIAGLQSVHAAITDLACFALAPTGQAAAPEPIKPDKATRARVSESYGKLPLSFEANEGQQDRQVKFLSRGSGYNLFLSNREAVLVLSKPEKPATPPAKKATRSQKKPKRQSTVLRTQLVAANPAAKVTGEQELPGKVNYLISNDPSKWRTNVATYAKVRYEQVYPGIDLVYYGNQRQLEYDFVVAPGADPARIRLSVAGAHKLCVDGQGQLVVQTAGGAVRWNKPEIYQQVDGRRRSVKGKYVLRHGHELSFEVAAYDTAKPLVIDPTLVYSTYLGGSDYDLGYGIAVDTSGNAYITGRTRSIDFPTTAGAFQTSNHGDNNVVVTKLNSTGTGLLYSTYLGGFADDWGYGIAVDTSGNAYVTGFASSPDFPTTIGAFQTTLPGVEAAFVTKLNPTGSGLLYSTFLGGSYVDYGYGIAVDISGNSYVTGIAISSDFPTTAGAFQTTYGGDFDAFVTEFNPSGSGLVYSTYLGGSNDDRGYGIAVDTSGNAYVTGDTCFERFSHHTAGAFQTTYGDVLRYQAQFHRHRPRLLHLSRGQLVTMCGEGIAVDTSGNAYVTGIDDFEPTFPLLLAPSRPPERRRYRRAS